ncbi:hypothetical protein AB0M02_12990 [Actinoplanes sp. NPDC051861]|uniref:hypothetical protein n=1 Tax=Actinoplanes sp. NPDC051861 TaxID=3155170 RepID=UPI00343C8B12
MRRRTTALTGAVLTGLTAAVGPGWAAPAAADEPGFSVTVDAPAKFTAGGNAKSVTAVVTSQNRQCRKVRWALLVHTAINPDQLKVTRIEEERAFPVQTRTEGVTTRIVDERVDPGTLCRGRTVTGRWQIEFDGPDADDVQFEAQAFDVRDRLLSTGGAATEVTGGDRPEPTGEPSAEPSEGAGAVAPEGNAGAAPPAGAGDADEVDAALAAEETSLLGPGLIVGGVFVFLGLLMLLRIRSRARAARRREEMIPTGFYTMPGSPR